jgi:hypothetical protein
VAVVALAGLALLAVETPLDTNSSKVATDKCTSCLGKASAFAACRQVDETFLYEYISKPGRSVM